MSRSSSRHRKEPGLPAPSPQPPPLRATFAPNPINAPAPCGKHSCHVPQVTQSLSARPRLRSVSWRSPASLGASVLQLCNEGVGLIHPRGRFETTPPFQVLSPLEVVTTGPGVTSQQLPPNLCTCLQVLGAVQPLWWQKRASLGLGVNPEHTPQGHLWAANQRDTSLSRSHCPRLWGQLV